MHETVQEWVQGRVRTLGLADKRTLELGSYDVNGTVRHFFGGEYVGIDMREGPGVDIVARSDKIPFPRCYFDVVVTTEMLEHDPFFWETFKEAKRVLRPGGYFLLTTRGLGFELHEYPSDFWRFTEAAIEHLLEWQGFTEIAVEADPVPGVFAQARKPKRS